MLICSWSDMTNLVIACVHSILAISCDLHLIQVDVAFSSLGGWEPDFRGDLSSIFQLDDEMRGEGDAEGAKAAAGEVNIAGVHDCGILH